MSQNESPRILIIDDDQVLLTTTQALLSAEGYSVTTHDSGFGGLSIISRIRPDLVLLDINMPGLSGPGLADAIRDEGSLSDTKIIFFSSADEESLKESVHDAGVHGFIRKGDRDQLRREVARALA